jgi:hypothetical protein
MTFAFESNTKAMFNSITWEIYTTAALVIALGYYVITSLLLYSSELMRWVKSRSISSNDLPLRETESISAQDSVIGGINQQEGSIDQRTSSVNLDAIAVTSQDEIQEDIVLPKTTTASSTSDHLLVGSVASLLEEIKTLVNLIVEYKSSKAEAAEFFHALFLRYPQLLNTTYQEAINLYILDIAQNQFSFDLSLKELAAWWTNKPSNK